MKCTLPISKVNLAIAIYNIRSPITLLILNHCCLFSVAILLSAAHTHTHTHSHSQKWHTTSLVQRINVNTHNFINWKDQQQCGDATTILPPPHQTNCVLLNAIFLQHTKRTTAIKWHNENGQIYTLKYDNQRRIITCLLNVTICLRFMHLRHFTNCTQTHTWVFTVTIMQLNYFFFFLLIDNYLCKLTDFVFCLN